MALRCDSGVSVGRNQKLHSKCVNIREVRPLYWLDQWRDCQRVNTQTQALHVGAGVGLGGRRLPG